MVKLFNQPYPAHESSGRELRKSALIGLFVGLFLLVFQPFGLTLWHTDYKAIKILGFGLETCLITAFMSVVLPRLVPAFFDEVRWTVSRQILVTTTTVVLIAVGNRLYIDALVGRQASGFGWVGMILATFLVALFPSAALIFVNYIRQLKKYSASASTLPTRTNPDHQPAEETITTADGSVVNSPTVTLISDNEKEKLSVPLSDLFYIESSDNYCTVVYQKNGQLTKSLLRSSLGRLEKQINQSRIVRCHRSYVVNLDRVERITGNAQGYKLHMQDEQGQVPVARQYNDSFVRQLKAPN